MHESLFANAPVKDVAQLTAQAKTIGLDVGKFSACMSTGRHAVAIRDSIERMQELGINGTPLTLIGITPAPGAPMKIVGSVVRRQAVPGLQSRHRRGARTGALSLFTSSMSPRSRSESLVLGP